jgi:hypothetical protein
MDIGAPGDHFMGRLWIETFVVKSFCACGLSGASTLPTLRMSLIRNAL